MKFFHFSAILFGLSACVSSAVEHEIDMSVIPGKMRYKVSSISAAPGDTVVIHFNNTDELQHNLLVCARGEENWKTVADLALKMGVDGIAKGFIPESPLVLMASRLLNPHEKQTLTFKVPLEEGIYPYVCTFPGHAQLMRGQVLVSTVRSELTDLRYDYYEGIWQKLPDFAVLTAVESGKLENNLISIDPKKQNDNFGFVYQGNLNVAFDGEYTFLIDSDDGSRVIVDDKMVTNHDGVHPDGEAVSGKVSLTRGAHNLRVEYFEAGGGEVLKVAWSGPGFTVKPLSTGTLSAPGSATEMLLDVIDEPLVVRCVLPDVSAKSIAVGLPGGLNYVFDTEACVVAYGWKGDFLDIGPERGNGKGRGGSVCRLRGERFPVAMEKPKAPVFKGYRRDTVEPVFVYEDGGKVINLRVTAGADGASLVFSNDAGANVERQPRRESAGFSPAPIPGLIPPGYRVETISPPEEVTFGVAGLDVAADGSVYAGTRYGQVWRLEPGMAQWTLFADGLHEITGLLCDRKTGQIFASQKPELTELIDKDGNGRADIYKVVTNNWGYKGNYHQYAYGPVRDKEGNFYGTLNLGHGGGLSVGGAIMTIDSPFRGTCYRVNSSGDYETFAWGLRSPAGIGINPVNDEIFYTDNQGDWNASSSLHHLTKGYFAGHPASLLYHPDYEGKDLNKLTPDDFAKIRKHPAVWIPHGELANSPGNPVFDMTGGKFGPFQGQMFVGDQTRSNVFRVVLDKVGDDYQGCAINMVDHLQCGAIRLAFAPDGSLWVGETSRGWGSVGGTPFGLQRIIWDGKSKPCEIDSVKLTKTGFELLFTNPVTQEAADPKRYKLSHWGYLYQGAYGSPKVDEKNVEASSAVLSADGLKVSLTVPELVTGQVYRISLEGVAGADGTAITGRTAYYTLNRVW